MPQDWRYAIRTLGRSPLFTLVAVVILGLGIGANTALFGTLATVLRPLPYAQPERLVALATSSRRTGVTFATSWLDFQDWQRQATSFTALAAYNGGPGTLLGAREPMRVEWTSATRNFFRILGVRPALGRSFSSTAHAPEAVISDALWRREFGASPAVLGHAVRLEGVAATIVGVLPPGAALPANGDIWIPADLSPDTASRSGHNWPGVVGRLRPGVPLASAQTEMRAIAQRLSRQYPDSNANESIAVALLQDQLVGGSSSLLWLLWAAAGLVLLIVCANLANLYLVRATGRQRESALRLALGATRWRLARQWMIEGLVVALAGGAVGLWLASDAGAYLRSLIPVALPGSRPGGPAWMLAAFALGVAVLAALLFAAAPAWQALPHRVSEQLKEGSGAIGDGSRRQSRLRQALVVGELALAMLVLAGAGLMLQTLRHLESLPLGFSTQQRTLAQLDLSGDRQRQEWTGILQRLRANPAVQVVGAASNVPFTRYDSNWSFEIAGRATSVAQAPFAYYHVASPDYFAAMGIPLLQGRDFRPSDGEHAPLVAVIDAAAARLYWPHQNPLGQRLRFYSDPRWITVIGVVGNTQHGGLRAAPRQQIYVSYLQHDSFMSTLGVVVRGSGNTAAAIRAAAAEASPDTPVTISSMDSLVATATAAPRLRATLFGGFALLAWILAALGIFGVISQDVARRRRELGIRLALGASGGEVMRSVLARSLSLAGLGVAIGLSLALVLCRSLTAYLFQVSAVDAATLALGAGVLLMSALLAAAPPAVRASHIAPQECLRAD